MFLADNISRAFLKETKEQILHDTEVNSFTYLPMTPEQYEDFQKANPRRPGIGPNATGSRHVRLA